MPILRLSLSLLIAAALLAPITADAKTSHMMSVQLPSGKTVELQTMKIHGQMMILVPMEMACDVFTSIAPAQRISSIFRLAQEKGHLKVQVAQLSIRYGRIPFGTRQAIQPSSYF
jgi:hypothetical protein